MKRIALVTARQALALDEDMPPLVQALASLGAAGEPVVWDDPAVRWQGYDLAVVRSTWDYAARRDEFVAWAERVGALTRLANPASVLRWNTDKTYLRELAGAGVPVVPTHWIGPADEVRIPFEGDVVVKPTISAGAKDTARHAARDSAAVHIRSLQSCGRSAMVQPYLTALDDAGETALVYVDGACSHAIRKGPILRPDVRYVDGLFAQEDIRPREADAGQRRLADGALARAPGPLLYARVDMAPGPDGAPVILEVELAEPSLFFAHAEGSARRMAEAILRRA
jgi:hypothetical protein